MWGLASQKLDAHRSGMETEFTEWLQLSSAHPPLEGYSFNPICWEGGKDLVQHLYTNCDSISHVVFACVPRACGTVCRTIFTLWSKTTVKIIWALVLSPLFFKYLKICSQVAYLNCQNILRREQLPFNLYPFYFRGRQQLNLNTIHRVEWMEPWAVRGGTSLTD